MNELNLNEDDFDFSDSDDVAADITEENYQLGYQVGFDAGFIEGFEEGQKHLMLESESTLYNKSLDDVIANVDKFEFAEKSDLMMILELLRRI